MKQLHDAHPGKPLILGVRSTNIPPRITVTPQEAVMSVPGAVDFYVVDEEDHTALTFTLEVVRIMPPRELGPPPQILRGPL